MDKLLKTNKKPLAFIDLLVVIALLHHS